MSKRVLLEICQCLIIVILVGCSYERDDYEEELFNRSEIVIYCSADVIDDGQKRLIRYKPIEVRKGSITTSMLDAHGYLKYTREKKLNTDVWNSYTLYIQKHKGDPTNTVFGFNYELDIVLD